MREFLSAWLAGESAEDLTGFRFEFNAPLSLYVCAALIAASALGIALWYAPQVARLSGRVRTLVVALRAASVALVLFLLLDPCIVAQRIKPGDHYAVLLYDDSSSMRIEGEDGRSRGTRMLDAVNLRDGAFERELARRFRVARYAAGETVRPIRSVRDLEFSDGESDLIGAVRSSLEDLSGLDVSAVILISDGLQQAEGTPAVPPAGFSRGVPVITVGTGDESGWRDIEVGPLTVTRAKFDKSPVNLTIPIRAAGLAGEEAVVEVMSEDRVLKSAVVSIPGDEADREVRMDFIPGAKDWIHYTARVRLSRTDPAPAETEPLAPGTTTRGLDRVPNNNDRSFLIDNREKVYRILNFAGRPNWENKFLRRALEEDRQLQLTSLLRVSGAERKFVFRGRKSGGRTNPLFEGFHDSDADSVRYDEAVFIRIGTEGSELDSGYPDDPLRLYPFDLVIWNEIEHDFFSPLQIETTREYVRKRGGSMIFMGGPRSFSQGNYRDTVVEAMLPVVLGPKSESGPPGNLKMNFQAAPTLEGMLAGSWILDPDPDTSRILWESMPNLSGFHMFPIIRPGATVMARALVGVDEMDGAPLFAMQRYGEGRTAMMATGATWQWRMQTEAEDNRHERLWRQLIRSLVDDVPEAVYLRKGADRYTIGRRTEFEWMIRDALFDERDGLQVHVEVAAPSATGSAPPAGLPVDESIAETGLYVTPFTPTAPGLHRIHLSATDDKGEVVASRDDALLVEPDRREFHNARYDDSLLREMARESGGRFFTLDQLSEVADAIRWEDNRDLNEVRIHLWHFPGFLALVVGMLASEWFIRRRKGFA